MTSPNQPLDTERLYAALSEVLQGQLEDEVTGYLDEDDFGRSTKGSLAHRFEEWIGHLVRRDGNVKELADGLGLGHGNQVLRALGVPRESGRFKRAEVVDELGAVLGVPAMSINGRAYYSEVLRRCCGDLDQRRTDHDSVASRLRQHSERLLREVALLANASGLTEPLRRGLLPGSGLRVPKGTPQDPASLDQGGIARLLLDDHWGDLGLLTILLGKASKAVRRGERPGTVEPLTIEEGRAFDNLSTALQDYAHFKPSQQPRRGPRLREALERLLDCVDAMQARRAIPQAAVLLTRTSGFFGQTYGGRTASGEWVRLRSDEDLPLGVRILFRSVSNPVHRLAGWVRVDGWR